MRRVLVIVLLLAGFPVGQVLASDRMTSLPVIVIEYPPFITEHTASYGLSFSVLTRQLAPYGYLPEPVFLPPARAAQIVNQSQDWLLSFFPADKNPNAELVILESAAISYSLFRMPQQQSFHWDDLQELKGATVVTTRQSAGSDDHNAFRKAGLTMMFVNEIGQAIQMVLAGRADYALTTKETGEYYLRSLNYSPDALQFADTLIRSYPHTVYLNHRHPQALDILNALRPAAR